MNSKIILVLLLFLSTTFVHADDSSTLSFQRLEGLFDHLPRESAVQHLMRSLSDYHQHEVRMRGFVYRAEDGRWVLSPEPQLKTCCIGSGPKIAQQVILSQPDEGYTEHKAITLQGIFYIEPRWDRSGNLVQLYRMDHVVQISEPWPVASLMMAGAGIAGVVMIWTMMRKQDE